MEWMLNTFLTNVNLGLKVSISGTHGEQGCPLRELWETCRAFYTVSMGGGVKWARSVDTQQGTVPKMGACSVPSTPFKQFAGHSRRQHFCYRPSESRALYCHTEAQISRRKFLYFGTTATTLENQITNCLYSLHHSENQKTYAFSLSLLLRRYKHLTTSFSVSCNGACVF